MDAMLTDFFRQTGLQKLVTHVANVKTINLGGVLSVFKQERISTCQEDT